MAVDDSNGGKLSGLNNSGMLEQLPAGKKASLEGILLSTGLLGFILYSTGVGEPQNPADRLTSGAGSPRTIEQAMLAARSQETRSALGRGTSGKPPLSEQHIQASLSALGDALAQAKAAAGGKR